MFRGEGWGEGFAAQFTAHRILSIRSGGSGTIHIWTKAEEHYNSLNFKIETNIVYMDSLKRASNNFFAIDDTKPIPGLGFCRLKCLSMDGNIFSEIEAGKYAHFVAKFSKFIASAT